MPDRGRGVLHTPATVRELLHQATQTLAAAGVDDPRAEARALLIETLRTTHAWALAHPEAPVPFGQQRALFAAVARRAAHEPFAYIAGHKEFYGLDLEVSPAVLVPRPETELLVDFALQECTRLAEEKRRPIVIADLGTGSGAVAIAIATHFAACHIIAIDRSRDAIAIAGRNVGRHGLAGRIDLGEGDLLAGVDDALDILVANLPYIPTRDIDDLMPEVAEYEPHSALDGGPDGTVLIKKALVQSASLMSPPAALLFEIGEGQGEPLAAYARTVYPSATVRVERDHAGLDRILWLQVE